MSMGFGYVHPPLDKMVMILTSDYGGDVWTKAKLVRYKDAKPNEWWKARFCDENGNKVASMEEVEGWRNL